MLHSCVVGISVSTLGGRTYFKILVNVNEMLLKSAPMSTITKLGQSFSTYGKNINGDGDADKYVYKIDHTY